MADIERLDGARQGSPRRLGRTGWLLCALYALLVAIALPYADQPGPVVPAITTAFGAGVLIADLCTCFLLLLQYRIVPAWPMLLLSGAYGYSACMALLHMLVFPGLWIPDQSLIGTPQSVSWLLMAWILGYPSLVLAAVVAGRVRNGSPIAQERKQHNMIVVLASVLAAAIVIAVIATTGGRWLPSGFNGAGFAAWTEVLQWSSAVIAGVALALLAPIAGRTATALYSWLAVALAAFAAFNVLAALGGGRYTIGWDLSRVSGFISAAVLLLFFLGQFAKLHRSLSDAVAQLRASNENLERSVEERTAELIQASRRNLFGEVSSAIAHEVSQPLSALASYLMAASRQLSSDPAKVPGTLDKSLVQVERAAAVIARMRDLLRPKDAGPQPEPLREVIEGAVALALLGHKGPEIAVEYRFDMRAPTAQIDRLQIEQALLSLIRNAIEAMAATPRPELRIETRGIEGGEIEISIADRGSGIAASVRSRLFQPFVTTKGDGMGIGLSVARAIVEAHGGRLQAEDRPGGGAVFRFTVPQAARPAQ